MPGLPENARAYRLKRLPEIGKSIPEILSGPTYSVIINKTAVPCGKNMKL